MSDSDELYGGRMTQIGVIIPVVRTDFIGGLLDCIRQNSVLPASIIIIDNSRKDDNLRISDTGLRMQIHRPSSPLGVNPSWNYGIQRLCDTVDLISVLNDDLLLETKFFEKLIRLTSIHTEASVLCPETVARPGELQHVVPVEKSACIRMYKREGWAWSAPSEVLRKVPPIPSDLQIWFGDDWLWLHTVKRMRRPWMKMLGNKCYHYVSQTSSKINGVSIRAERQLFEQHI